jgi:mRNA interferase HicA
MKSSEFLNILKSDGWYVVRQVGSHLIMRHGIKKGQLTVPYHGSKEIAKGLMNKLLKQAGLKD